jgi:hypothetical protein
MIEASTLAAGFVVLASDVGASTPSWHHSIGERLLHEDL